MDNRTHHFPKLPERISGLEEIAANLWWSWHPPARMLFKRLSRPIWKEGGHNPDKTLREIPYEVFERASRDREYLRHYDIVLSQFRREMKRRSSDVLDRDVHSKPTIAYFSSEYGLHHSLPFYAGGLGFLAGDFLKECSDLRLPLVAIGFMYPGGYLRQIIREDGWQEGEEQSFDRDAASISRVQDDNGDQLTVVVPMVMPPIHVAVWKVDVGRIPLYLMDTEIEQNDPWNREISARLYAADLEKRLRQEIVLGIGGSEVLAALGIEHAVLHLNEGHAAFAILERIRDRVQEGASYEEASKRVRQTTVFTTHTPVPAGHDIFPFHLMEKYFCAYWPSLSLEHDQFLGLGIDPREPQSGFNMTSFALRMSGYRNGVSIRHGEVTRKMWVSLWPGTHEADVPIDSVTNGIHVPTWIEPKMELLFNKYLGPEWIDDHDNPLIWELVDEIPDEELWRTHYWLKLKLINILRNKSREKWSRDGASPTVALTGGALMDPSVLTIGFARRFATYKRADLIFIDMVRMKQLLNDRWRPIQIVFAGKAHPADDPGKQMLQRIVQTAKQPQTAGRIAFVEDYGEQLAQYLVHGVDIWLNTPLPPMEACGTSGMKAALNGVPQLGISDGWWIEGYNGQNGWIFGEDQRTENRSDTDAKAIYQILEEYVLPVYYAISDEGVPSEWVKIMKATIKAAGQGFSARRMVRAYVEKFYAPAIKNI